MAMWCGNVLSSLVMFSECLRGKRRSGSSDLENHRPLKSSSSSGVGECRGRLASDDRRGLVNELVVLEGLHHEQGKVHTAREVARQDWIAYVFAPHGQTLAFALLEVATAHDCPPGVAG